MASPSPVPAADAAMGESLSSRDWGATALGPTESRPPALAFAVEPVNAERRLSFQVSLADRFRGIHDPEEA